MLRGAEKESAEKHKEKTKQPERIKKEMELPLPSQMHLYKKGIPPLPKHFKGKAKIERREIFKRVFPELLPWAAVPEHLGYPPHNVKLKKPL